MSTKLILEIMEGLLVTLERKLEEAIEMVKDLGAEDRVKAGIIWNSYSAQLQAIINSTIGETSNDSEIEYNSESCTTTTNTAVLTDSDSLFEPEPSSTATSMTGNYICCSQEVSDEDYDDDIGSTDNNGLLMSPLKDADGGLTTGDIDVPLTEIMGLAHNGKDVDVEISNSIDEDIVLNTANPDDSKNEILGTGALGLEAGEDMSVDLDNKFKCGTCHKAFFNGDLLKSHVKSMHPKLFKCDECDASFSTKGNFNVHKRKHTGDRPFPCPKCTNRFTTSGNLRRHLLSHQGLKPYQCSTCDSRFTEKKSLLVHMRSHTGEKPYECPTCHKKFSQSSILSQHLVIHKDSKPHLCPQCGKSFTQKSQLRLHELRHSGVKSHACQSCDSSFTAKSDLIRHQKTHTGEKAFVCEQCGKTFARSQSLKEHMFKHSGVKPYSCPKCESTFSDLSGYRKHLKKH